MNTVFTAQVCRPGAEPARGGPAGNAQLAFLLESNEPMIRFTLLHAAHVARDCLSDHSIPSISQPFARLPFHLEGMHACGQICQSSKRNVFSRIGKCPQEDCLQLSRQMPPLRQCNRGRNLAELRKGDRSGAASVTASNEAWRCLHKGWGLPSCRVPRTASPL